MRRRSVRAHGGALAGLVMLWAVASDADEALRREIQRDHRHDSYVLVEDADGARLYLFADAGRADAAIAGPENDALEEALALTRSADARARVRGLVALAGMAERVALDVALELLADPNPAVRAEARQVLLDHPDGADLAASLGLATADHE